ncbi:hypothetical protein BC941DRAFT_455916 [Chlamydoabsidia padenii]|nr:hypothetical protein BC941DRAFT_455916 [Chlamydoabsidia padenii]
MYLYVFTSFHISTYFYFYIFSYLKPMTLLPKGQRRLNILFVSQPFLGKQGATISANDTDDLEWLMETFHDHDVFGHASNGLQVLVALHYYGYDGNGVGLIADYFSISEAIFQYPPQNLKTDGYARRSQEQVFPPLDWNDVTPDELQNNFLSLI